MKAVVIGNLPEPSRVLMERGFQVIPAGDGVLGIRKTLALAPDVVVLPVDLPHLHGINLAKILDLLGIRIPLVFVSGDSAHRERTRAFPATLSCLFPDSFAQEFNEGLIEQIKHIRVSTRGKDKAQAIRINHHDWVNLLSIPGRKRILVVEDSDVIARYILTVLESREEYEIYTAEDGREGLLKAVTVNPDLILTDIQMPQLDGLSMAQILFILGKPIPLVFVTGNDSNELLTRARRLEGVVGYLLKAKLRDTAAFDREVTHFLKIAQTLRQTSQEVYREGA
ncbi:MAG: response regulator, partial [Deltaproteobacteria bacterium]|nr:response regulator [Deltaproteobacteria bacterium]